ncbi:MAG: hypothetical protein QNK37_32435 [Acidobacteriota bacterium]|nr:hypothetical protein [Acidobacteriota bacterium]
MLIGIDLDNTILDYSELFPQLARERNWLPAGDIPSKAALKRGLAETAGDAETGELRWQRLQALAYGPQIGRARLFDGFTDFVRTMRDAGHRLVIVSHKSRTSNLDPSVNLHDWARKTLSERGFFDELGFARGEVYFEETRDEKLARIQALQPDVFIDDLPKVFQHPGFPADSQGLLFGRDESLPAFDHWEALTEFCPCLADLRALNPAPLEKVETIRRGGNNHIRKLTPAEGPPVVLKTYFQHPDDPRPRRDSELRFLEILWRGGIRNIPRPLGRTRHGLFQAWIDGSPPEGQPEGLAALQNMLTDLDRLSRESAGSDAVGPAAHARFRLADYRRQIEARWTAVGTSEHAAVRRFLDEELQKHRETALQFFEEACRTHGLEPEAPLPLDLRYLSPSDYGPHNCLKTAGGEIFFLDFEYAGWDDPAKLLCDFTFHVGFDMDRRQRLDIVKTFIRQREHDPHLIHRLAAVWRLMALEWILIVLNVAVPAELARKCFADPSLDPAALVSRRLEKARRMANALAGKMDRTGPETWEARTGQP